MELKSATCCACAPKWEHNGSWRQKNKNNPTSWRQMTAWPNASHDGNRHDAQRFSAMSIFWNITSSAVLQMFPPVCVCLGCWVRWGCGSPVPCVVWTNIVTSQVQRSNLTPFQKSTPPLDGDPQMWRWCSTGRSWKSDEKEALLVKIRRHQSFTFAFPSAPVAQTSFAAGLSNCYNSVITHMKEACFQLRPVERRFKLRPWSRKSTQPTASSLVSNLELCSSAPPPVCPLQEIRHILQMQKV